MKRLDLPALMLLVATTPAIFLIVADAPWKHLADASYGAALCYLVVVAVILAQWLRGKRGSRFERWLMAVFLASMPLVYVSAAARSAAGVAWTAIEVGGFIVFAAVAALGMRVSAWFLVGGM